MIYVIISRPGQDNFVYRYPPIGGTIKTLVALAEESLTHANGHLLKHQVNPSFVHQEHFQFSITRRDHNFSNQSITRTPTTSKLLEAVEVLVLYSHKLKIDYFLE